MKKRVFGLFLLLIAVTAVCLATSCSECEHVYDNECDAVCNECEEKREVDGHVYSFSCDKECNECGFTREEVIHTYSSACVEYCTNCRASRTDGAMHVYSSDCDAECNVCGGKRTPAEHVYTNACDTECNLCGTARTAGAHFYDNECDTECNECGAVRTVNGHTYSYDCDTKCNFCTFVREAEEHTYSGDCDKTCNVCSEEREINGNHTYSADCDAECNVCGETRTANGAHLFTADCDATCNNCGLKRTNVQDHNWRKKVTVVQRRTCTDDEIVKKTCLDCEHEELEVRNKAFGHDYDPTAPYVFNNDATHTKDGTESQYCIYGDGSRNQRPAPGTAGHCFDSTGKCKECGWIAPVITNSTVYESFESYNKLNQTYTSTVFNANSKGNVKAETSKLGVTYTVVSRGNVYGQNIRALKIAREASANESGNDALVDAVPTTSVPLTAKHVVEFEIMIGSSNGSNIYLNGRKEKGGSAVFNQFVWYNDAYKSVLIGNTTLVEGVEDNQWYKIALAIDDEEKTYDIYVEGVKVLSGIEYVKADSYYSHSEAVAGCYRFTANKGTAAVEFYLDNISVYNGEYAAR